ncbi:MAG: hypothetical protein IJG43_02640 [Acidaminococcaceae bacterium]|nr:hypothetical protein [Acidaminococcaceae bacterium]
MNTKNLTIQSLQSLKEDTAGIVYAILQLKRGDEYHYKRFESYNRTVRGYGRINIEDYDFKGAFQLETGETETAHLLEEIFRFWNMPARPSWIRFTMPFTGHSLSVSDIVALYQDNKIRFFFCDRFGFKELINETIPIT